MRMRFNEYGFTTEKAGLCSKCGKYAKRSKRFWQTINPFNKDKNGNVKTYDQIMKECRLESNKWKSEPILHAKCE